MASEAARPDDNMDTGTTTGSPPRPSPPTNVPSQEANGDDTASAPLGQEPTQGTVAAASTIRALDDDDPPIPLLHVVDETEGTASDGPQLHDGPPGPPRFPLEYDDSLAKRVDVLERHSSDRADPPGPPPCFPCEFDDSLAKRADNELERNRPHHAGDDTSTARSTMGASVASAEEAAVGPSMVEGAEEGSSFSRVSAPSMSSRTELVEATAAAGLHTPSGGRSTFIAEAYRVEGDTVYVAELAEPEVAEPSSSQAILPFYQRKGFVLVMIAVTLLLVVITVASVVLLSKNLPSDDMTETSSTSIDLQIPLPITNVPTAPLTNEPTSNPMKNLTSPPTTNPTNIPTNLTTRPPLMILNSSLKLLAPDGAANDYFGSSAVIYGDTIVAGAFKDDYIGMNSGSAHVFVRSGGSWTYQAKLLAPDGAAGDYFGWCVANYEDTVVVGAPWDDDNGERRGSAHVFVRSGDEWTHQAKLLAPDGAANDYFGKSVSIYEDTIVVGADGDDDNGSDSGSAHVFVRSGEEWIYQAKLLASDGAAYDDFGYSTAIYEDTIVVGATWDDDNGLNSGSAHVFVRSGDEWMHQAKLLAPDGAADDYFGGRIAVQVDTVVVGAPLDDSSGERSRGSAHVFVRSGEQWTRQAKLLAPDGAERDYFGISVAIYKDTIVVGATEDDDNGSASGSAHIFFRNGEDWKHHAKLLAADGAVDDYLGRSVALYEDTIVVGAPCDYDESILCSGSAHVFVV